eukprot:NODE_289_length_10645_cov_0.615115.p3 type:complete len:386 gc:universal NODE_289_length_10645_cov_0.615115:6543-7700(+)
MYLYMSFLLYTNSKYSSHIFSNIACLMLLLTSLSAIIPTFKEVKNSYSHQHIIEKIDVTENQCLNICAKDEFCMGYSHDNVVCTRYFYLPQFSMESSSFSLFIKDSPFPGSFFDHQIFMRRACTNNCDGYICDYEIGDKWYPCNNSIAMTTNLTLKFENHPLLIAPFQYWKNISDNTSLFECLLNCDKYPSCNAVQYIFNDTTCAMLDVWPGELLESDINHLRSKNLDGELFLKTDYHSLGFRLSNTIPILSDSSLNITLNECLNFCKTEKQCQSVYYDTRCYLYYEDIHLLDSQKEGLHFIKMEAAVVATTTTKFANKTTIKTTKSPSGILYLFRRFNQYRCSSFFDYFDNSICRIHNCHHIFLLFYSALECSKRNGYCFKESS